MLEKKLNLHVEDLSFSYRNSEKIVLDSISFTASEGRLICLLGENGAGKSTLFKCILGFLSDYKGKILIEGSEVSTLSTKELAGKIAYIPQTHNSVFPFSVFDMVLMGTTASLKTFENPGKAQKEKAMEALDMVGISYLAHKNFSEISGGEQQLTLVARALAQNTKILLMDEPCSNLDYGNQMKVMQRAKDLSRQGHLILQSTHNPEHVFMFSDEVIVLKSGKIHALGATATMLTEDVLKDIYGIKIKLYEIDGRKVHVPSPCCQKEV